MFLDTAAANFTPSATLGGLTKNMCIPTLAESALVARALNGLLQRIKPRRENSLWSRIFAGSSPSKKRSVPEAKKLNHFFARVLDHKADAFGSSGYFKSLLNSIHQIIQQTNDFHLGGLSVVSQDTVAAERSSVMTCLELALTAQLICVSGQTIVCTDNSSIAQLLGVSACTITERSRSNDDYRRIQAQRDKPLR